MSTTEARPWVGPVKCRRCGYRWVHVHRDEKEPEGRLWCHGCHHPSGYPVEPDYSRPFPPDVRLCGCNYRVAEHEGAIVFTETDPVWGTRTRFTLTRACGCWYIEAVENPRVMVEHIAKAMEFVAEYRGGNHENIGQVGD